MNFIDSYESVSVLTVHETSDETISSYLEVTDFIRLKSQLLAALKRKNIVMGGNEMQEEQQQSNYQKQELHTTQSKQSFCPSKFQFSLLLNTDKPQWDIYVHILLNFQLPSIMIRSTPLVSSLFINNQCSELICSVNRYLISTNGRKDRHNSFIIHPKTGQLWLNSYNQLTLNYLSAYVKSPYQFQAMLMSQLSVTKKYWEMSLHKLLYYLNKSNLYNDSLPDCDEFINQLSSFITSSHIEYPFMYDNTSQSRFEQLSETQILRKYKQYENLTKIRNYKKQDILEGVKEMIDKCTKNRVKNRISEEKMIEMKSKDIIRNINCQKIMTNKGSKILSQVKLVEIIKEISLMNSRFSSLTQCQMIIISKTILNLHQQQQRTINLKIVRKLVHQYQRYRNQVQIINVIGDKRCLFIPKYFKFIQKEQVLQNSDNNNDNNLKNNMNNVNYANYLNLNNTNNLNNSSNQSNAIHLEYYPQKSLQIYLHKTAEFLSLETKLSFLYQVCIALSFLRDNNITHIDLKPQNILMKIQGDRNKQKALIILKLIDFGQSYYHTISNHNLYFQQQQQIILDLRGFTLPYASPQLIQNAGNYNQQTDVFSFGVIIYKLIFNCLPRDLLRIGKKPFKKCDQYLKFFSSLPEKGQYYGFQQLIEILYLLCLKCLNPHANRRPTLVWLIHIIRECSFSIQQRYGQYR